MTITNRSGTHRLAQKRVLGWSLLTLATLSSLGGCGSSSKKDAGDGGPSLTAPATAGEACMQLNMAAASLGARCSGGALTDWLSNQTTQLDCAAYDRHVAEGRVEYRPQSWAACLQQYALPCDQANPFPCPYEILFGKVSDGEPCEDFEVCGPVSTCFNVAGLACGDVCVRLGKELERCGLYCGGTSSCLDGFFCGSNLFCQDGTCVKTKALGEVCGGPQGIVCSDSLFCDSDPTDAQGSGVCAQRHSGGSCRGDISCVQTEFCLAGTCTPRLPARSPCADAPNGGCTAFTVCDTNGSGVCAPAGRIGQACALFQGTQGLLTCSMGTCNGVTCVAQPARGDSCGDPAVSCVQGTFCDATTATCLACGRFGDTDGGACPSIANIGMTVVQVAATGPIPTPVGGVVADGTYVLTQLEAYPPVTADPPTTERATLNIVGTSMTLALESTDFPAGKRGTATFTTSGTNSTITWTCGSTGSFQQGYTATATSLVLISAPGSIATYTRQ